MSSSPPASTPGISEIPNVSPRDGSLIFLTLKEYFEANERIDLKYSRPIDSPIVRPAGHHDPFKSMGTQKALTDPLEAPWGKPS